jgi:hypothetical protein
VRSPSISANRTALVETAQTPVRARHHRNLRLQPSAQRATPGHQRTNEEEYGGNEYGGLPVLLYEHPKLVERHARAELTKPRQPAAVSQ